MNMNPEDDQHDSFLDQQFEELRNWKAGLGSQGLFLDFLFEHISNKDGLNQLSRARAEEIFSHIEIDISILVQKFIDLGLLIEVSSDDPGQPNATRLANDAFAPLVRHRF